MMHAPHPHQRALPMYGQEPEAPRRPVRRPSGVRALSRETYNLLADTGALGSACTKVMRSLKYFINSKGYAPTPAELTRHMAELQVINRESVNLVAPRLTELANGKVRKLPDGSTVRVGGREIELLPLRICRVTGNKAPSGAASRSRIGGTTMSTLPMFGNTAAPRAGKWTPIDSILGSMPGWSRASGCYALYIDGRLVYIGSSGNIYARLSIYRRACHISTQTEPGPLLQTPFGSGGSLTAKIKLSRRYGDWLMVEARLIRRLQPCANTLGVCKTRRVS